MQSTLLRAAGALSALALLAACSADSTAAPGAAAPVSLSFAVGASSSTGASLSLAPSADIAIAASTDSLVITSARLVVKRIELARADSAACLTASDTSAEGLDDGRDDDSERSGCLGLELGPRVVSLPVDSSSKTSLDLDLPQGSYRFMEAKIRPARASDSKDAAFVAANPDLDGASVIVEGRFDGRAFTYKGRIEAGIERTFDPPLSLDATGTNVGVSVDLATWFRDGSGRLVDPSTANAGGANERLVARNVKRSFKAFEDRDHDGRDDHGGSGEGESGGNGGGNSGGGSSGGGNSGEGSGHP